MSRVRRGEWARCYLARPSARRRLVCFPHAGGSASFFRPWVDALPDDVELWAVQYPGREDRFGEAHPADLGELADRIAEDLAPALDGPVTVFGHSMGASVGYEVTRGLLARRPGAVERLVVSARPSPSHQRAARNDFHLRDEEALVAEIRVLGGAAPAVLDHPGLRALLLPVVREDFRLIEDYHPGPREPLPVPITALTGDADPRVTGAQAAGWAEATRAGFRLVTFPGDHFYLVPHREEVVRLLVGGRPAEPPLPR